MGSPQVVVNMNVSWMKYAPLWILERIPEVYQLAERKGASSTEIDRWRRHTLPGIVHYFSEIYKEDQKGNSAFFYQRVLCVVFSIYPILNITGKNCWRSTKPHGMMGIRLQVNHPLLYFQI
jgi:hypothetical protein